MCCRRGITNIYDFAKLLVVERLTSPNLSTGSYGEEESTRPYTHTRIDECSWLLYDIMPDSFCRDKVFLR